MPTSTVLIRFIWAVRVKQSIDGGVGCSKPSGTPLRPLLTKYKLRCCEDLDEFHMVRLLVLSWLGSMTGSAISDPCLAPPPLGLVPSVSSGRNSG